MIDNLISLTGSRMRAFELLYVMDGAKHVIRQGYPKAALPQIQKFCDEQELMIEHSPHKMLVADTDLFSNKGLKVPLSHSETGLHMVYISQTPDAARLANMYEIQGKHRELGILLGYPPCCVDFFAEHQEELSSKDYNFLGLVLYHSKEGDYSFHTNITQREQDLSLLSHFPCNLACKQSHLLAQNHLQVITKHDPKYAKAISDALKGERKIDGKIFHFH